ncbi:hypothetical protein BDP27DRAFT_1401982 [Rhodocollybia butyracea]|uniref:Uncharacterized protein n=1 Tax=Rhodocollybia butyracea TaxID=206335 RepID=A0A9P5PUZ2_9AGAR|nr:hypothetical protein BDP27DRAFT_1401982 [Rhodocollybia butyracea]
MARKQLELGLVPCRCCQCGCIFCHSCIVLPLYMTYRLRDPTPSTWLPPISFLELKLSSWLASVTFAFALVVAVRWFELTRYYAKFYRTKQLDLVRADQKAFELYLMKVELCLFIHACELYLPVIEAAVDWRVLSNETRKEYEKTVRKVRKQIAFYRSFGNVAVTQVSATNFRDGANIIRPMTTLLTMNYTYPCTQQSDQDKLDKIFEHIGDILH